MNIGKNKVFLILILLGYFLLSLSFLDVFPFLHSDESWLSGLSRNILENRDFSVTETFFDLKPRNPHAIKILFHSLQILFLSVMPYSIFTFRLISLIFAILSIVLVYKITLQMTQNKIASLFATCAIAVDVQFIYASHFARQEIILVFTGLAAFYYYIRSETYYEKEGLKKALILGSVIGLSIGIHPNSFIISIPFFLLYFYDIFIEKKVSLKSGIIFTLTVSAFAAVYIALSLYFDINFFANYAAYGSEFEVQSPLASKFAQSLNYYQKLFYSISGTYYTPEIKLQLILFSLTFISAAGIIIKKGIQKLLKKTETEKISDIPSTPSNEIKHHNNVINLLNPAYHNTSSDNLTHDDSASIKSSRIYYIIKLLIAIVGINLGTIIIGRYNQTSIIFQFPFFYMLVAVLLSLKNNEYLTEQKASENRAKNIIYILIVFCITLSSALNIVPFSKYSYDDYLLQISKYVSPSDTVLANLNTEYYFENGKLFDYRNLAYLQKNDMTFKEYIKKNNIDFIILPEEMEFIYNKRPTWNGIYGNPSYYEEMIEFIEESCSLQGEFSNPIYPMRIVRYIGVDNVFNSYIPRKEWQVKIYKVER